MKLSFVIPTLNEERNIPRVIKQFDKLKGKYDFEVIVSDGGSTDRTVKIARNLGAIVIVNKLLHTIGEGRNLGAKNSSGDLLFFFDADTAIVNVTTFIRRATKAFNNQEIVAAIPKLRVFPEKEKMEDRVFVLLMNSFFRLSFMIGVPFASGQCQIVRRDAFERVGGYNGIQAHAEDTSLFRKLNKIGKLHYFSDLIVYESPRRYRKVGYMRLALVGITSFMAYSLFKINIVKKWKRVS